ncbi:hypothetical protein C7M62_15225 [Bradyrhizobium sp. WBAH10]|nr:hypothetical protein [Bradyrhizobium sp. WBAH10]
MWLFLLPLWEEVARSAGRGVLSARFHREIGAQRQTPHPSERASTSVAALSHIAFAKASADKTGEGASMRRR